MKIFVKKNTQELNIMQVLKTRPIYCILGLVKLDLNVKNSILSSFQALTFKKQLF